MNTKRRFNRLVATQARLKALWWEHQLSDDQHNLDLSWEQTRRKRVLRLLESALNDICWCGVADG